MRTALSRRVWSRIAAVGAALIAGSATLLIGPAPAHAETVFIEVNPSTILAGFSVSLRASCGSTVNPAKATSNAFGSAAGAVILTPENGFLIGTGTIPATTAPHGYSVKLTCATGGTATTTLWVISATSKPTKGPNTGGGYFANNGKGGGTAMLAGGLAAVGAGGVLAVWAARRRRGVK